MRIRNAFHMQRGFFQHLNIPQNGLLAEETVLHIKMTYEIFVSSDLVNSARHLSTCLLLSIQKHASTEDRRPLPAVTRYIPHPVKIDAQPCDDPFGMSIPQGQDQPHNSRQRC